VSAAQAIHLTIPAKAEYITLVRLALTGLWRLRSFSEEALADLKLAVTEACSNSVRHAYGDGTEGTVRIDYELHSDRLVIEVSDDGEGFDRDRWEDDRSELTEGGLGLAIIRSLTDELELADRDGDKGFRLRFVKLLEAKPS
jgi:serine/threonine-protein kinase RsbW